MTTLVPAELAAIRERHRKWQETLLGADPTEAWVGDAWATDDVGRLLAHIDAITEAVEGLPTWHCYSDNGVDQGEHIERDEALALLRGER